MAITQNQQAQRFWSDHLEQWQSTGLSQAAYCRQYDLCQQKFSYRKRQSSFCEENAHTSTGFARVQVEGKISSDDESGLSLRLNDDIYIEGIAASNLTLVQSLLAVLR